MQESMQTTRRPAHLFKPGQSGNPSGCTKSKRYLELRADVVSDLGGEDALSGIDRVIVGLAVTQLIRAERANSDVDAVHASNTASRLLASLRKRERQPAGWLACYK